MQCSKCRGAVAPLVECPSEVPVWCNSTDMDSKHAAALELGKNVGRRSVDFAHCRQPPNETKQVYFWLG